MRELGVQGLRQIKYFKENGINHIITLSHAAAAERNIRIIKSEIYKRVTLPSTTNWSELIFQTLVKYNHKSVHSSTGYTPADAEKKGNHINVKLHMEMNKNKARVYPDIEEGDYVRIHENKDKLDKEHTSTWSDMYSIRNNIFQKGVIKMGAR